MPMSTTGIKPGRNGFTIIELMVVLVIIALMTGTVVVAMGPALRDAKMRSACRIVASSLNYARSHAVTTGMTTRVVFDRGRSVEVEVIQENPDTGTEEIISVTTSSGRRHGFPDGVEVSGIIKTDTVEEDENWVEFTKLGQAEDAIIELTDADKQKRYVVIDPITGRCRVQTSEDIEQEQKTGLDSTSK